MSDQKASECVLDELLDRILGDNEKTLSGIDVSPSSFKVYLSNVTTNSIESDLYTHIYETLGYHSGLIIQGLTIPKETTEEYRLICVILHKLRRFKFLACEFHCESIDLGDERNTACHYEQCTFKEPFAVEHGVVLSNSAAAMFDRCHFECAIRLSGSLVLDDLASDKPATAFSCCTFASDIVIDQAVLDAPIFLDQIDSNHDIPRQLGAIRIEASRINDRFILNNYIITKFECFDTVFDCKVEMKNCHISTFSVLNTNYKQLADFFATEFRFFLLQKSILSDFVGFERCVFGDQHAALECSRSAADDRTTRFRYVTFLSFANFRNAKFNTTLDLKNSNRKELPNFIGCVFSTEAQQKTDRETFRIIKHSFDAVGNHVEGNAFFAMEMGAYRRELKGTDRYAERFLLWCNHVLADFGQSYWRPIIWLISLASVFYLLRHGYQKNWLYQIYPNWNGNIQQVSVFLNQWADSFKVFKPLMFEGMEFVSLLFGILFSVLIWLTVVSIRRHSKR